MCCCRDVSYRGFWFVPWLFGKPEAERQAVIQKTLQLMQEKVLDPPIGEYGLNGTSGLCQPGWRSGVCIAEGVHILIIGPVGSQHCHHLDIVTKGFCKGVLRWSSFECTVGKVVTCHVALISGVLHAGFRVAGKVFPLKDFAEAVAESQKVGRLGKVLLKLQ